jgi:hypothetical protein
VVDAVPEGSYREGEDLLNARNTGCSALLPSVLPRRLKPLRYQERQGFKVDRVVNMAIAEASLVYLFQADRI